MIFSRFSHSLFTLAVSGGILLCPLASRAGIFTYHVDLNVASLVTIPPTGGYSLDFQLNGDGLPATATNGIAINNFTFTPLTLGGASGTPTAFGAASGNLSSQVHLTLTSTNTLNELYQGFTATTTDIQFDVTTTGNGSGITPDTFLIQILDGSLNPIATNAPDGISLLTQTINGPVTLASVKTYNSTTPTGVTATAAPEPSTWAAVLLGMGLLLRVVLRRRPALG